MKGPDSITPSDVYDTQSTQRTNLTSFTMSQARENLERISLGLPVTDAAGNYFPPTIRSDSEKETLRELARARSEIRYLERQVIYAQIQARCAETRILLERARRYESQRRGLFSELISTLTFGVF
jgi:hypothetical protein